MPSDSNILAGFLETIGKKIGADPDKEEMIKRLTLAKVAAEQEAAQRHRDAQVNIAQASNAPTGAQLAYVDEMSTPEGISRVAQATPLPGHVTQFKPDFGIGPTRTMETPYSVTPSINGRYPTPQEVLGMPAGTFGPENEKSVEAQKVLEAGRYVKPFAPARPTAVKPKDWQTVVNQEGVSIERATPKINGRPTIVYTPEQLETWATIRAAEKNPDMPGTEGIVMFGKDLRSAGSDPKKLAVVVNTWNTRLNNPDNEKKMGPNGVKVVRSLANQVKTGFFSRTPTLYNPLIGK